MIEFDRALLAQYGLSIGEANRIINMAFAGQSTGMVFEGEKRFDMVVRLAEDKREKYRRYSKFIDSYCFWNSDSIESISKSRL